MSFEGMGISLSLIILVVLWIAAPLISRRNGKTVASSDHSLITSYERTLVAIRDLDEDYTTGKIDAAAYARERELWVQRGIAALRMLDAAGQFAPQTQAIGSDESDNTTTDPVEQALATYRRSTHRAALKH
jgi:hypothetical protein